MIKKVIFLSFLGISISSCTNQERKETKKIECVVTSCENVKKVVSVHDEINRDTKRWEIGTSCGFSFFSVNPQNIGDTLEISVEKSI